MIIHKPHPLIRPLIRPLPGLADPLAGIARRALHGALSDARHGCLELTLPGNEVWQFGEPTEGEAATVVIGDPRALVRLLLRGELGVGEAYVAGEWDSGELVTALRWFARNLAEVNFGGRLAQLGCLPDLIRHRLRTTKRGASDRNISAHYDLGNEFYALFLDPRMVYSCAEFRSVDDSTAVDADDTLAEAQERKLERICANLELGADDHLLEIGCGWGALAVHAARTRGCRVTAVTLSKQQLEFTRERVTQAGLDHLVEPRYADYRELRGSYDAIASIEMLEAVGYRGLPLFFSRCGQLLRGRGRALVQTITMPDERFPAYRRSVDWMQTYIFPGSLIPSRSAIDRAMAGSGLRLTRHRELGPHYAPTLRAWRHRFRESLDRARVLGVDEPFERSWELYLAFSEASFAERSLGVSQLLLTRG